MIVTVTLHIWPSKRTICVFCDRNTVAVNNKNTDNKNRTQHVATLPYT